MDVVTRGFAGRRGPSNPRIPPGQYLERDFPVLSAGPTPGVRTEEWRLDLVDTDGARRSLSWADLMALPREDLTTDIHCVTKWSKLDTTWRGVPLEAVLDGAGALATHVLVHSYGGYTTNLPMEDVTGGRAWVATHYGGKPLTAEHGGPARLLVPHLYFWKSAKWVRGLEMLTEDHLGFWEQLGYHALGDPWREQRYVGD
ncbi:sulfite oxidase-like oxidoreductase [Phycicoccus avicenniae]|uniref:sulfite oxidase-like oxidoreductase n=1 Tax=Phycicoccus avicenniae TaxID=2828860 RepID=UPI003D2AEB25